MMHEQYMQRCIQLARGGLNKAFPNPLVGSVIVHQGKIIGEGFHQEYGKPHAEVNAINSVSDKSLLKDSTLYVNLEPCAHFGKTPPCANLIIQHHIPRVVIGCVDSYKEVSGKGVILLKDAGIDVITGVLEEECVQLNRVFFKLHENNRPFITLKWAESADGFFDRIRNVDDVGINWLTTNYTKQWVHKIRSKSAAIVVGSRTWLTDKPQLTVRLFAGESPKRIILSKDNRLPLITNEDVVFTGDLMQLLDYCKSTHLHSLLVEGGAMILSDFIAMNLWDEAFVFKGQTHLGTGVLPPKTPMNTTNSVIQLPGGDLCTHYTRI